MEPTFKPLFEYAHDPVSNRWIAKSDVLHIVVESDSKEEMVESVGGSITAFMSVSRRFGDTEGVLKNL